MGKGQESWKTPQTYFRWLVPCASLEERWESNFHDTVVAKRSQQATMACAAANVNLTLSLLGHLRDTRYRGHHPGIHVPFLPDQLPFLPDQIPLCLVHLFLLLLGDAVDSDSESIAAVIPLPLWRLVPAQVEACACI